MYDESFTVIHRFFVVIVVAVGLCLRACATNGTSEHYACTHSGSKLNMRSGAGQNFKVVSKVDHGTPLLVVDARKAKDGFEWYKVRAGKRVGWVRSDYACF